MSNSAPSVSFVLPCLNEGETLGEVLTKINEVCNTDFGDRQTEVIVVDNGSTDASVEIARQCQAQIVHCDERGYGKALIAGIAAAANDIVVFADADNTYDLLEAPRLVHELEKGHDLVLGSRLQGTIHRGAMPFLHRYLGTPALNLLLNLLYGRGGCKITDCNSGFRCFRRKAFLEWEVGSSGMEFASEMLVKAMRSGAKLTSVPISLYPDRAGRAPHLQRWRDGMRHMLQIFLESPEFFFVTGCLIFLTSWVIILLGLLLGPVSVGFAVVFGLHSMLFALLGTLFGMTVWATGLFLAVRGRTDIRTYRYLIDLPEDTLFWASVLVTLLSAGLFLGVVILWATGGFRDLYFEKQTLAIVAFAANGMLFVSNLITAHLLKRP